MSSLRTYVSVVLAILLVLTLGCSKEEAPIPESPIVLPPNEKPGFDYWLNSNETWHYEYFVDVPIEYNPYRSEAYKVLRDTVILDDSISVKGKVLLLTLPYLGTHPDSLDKYSREVVIYYIKEKRQLEF